MFIFLSQLLHIWSCFLFLYSYLLQSLWLIGKMSSLGYISFADISVFEIFDCLIGFGRALIIPLYTFTAFRCQNVLTYQLFHFLLRLLNYQDQLISPHVGSLITNRSLWFLFTPMSSLGFVPRDPFFNQWRDTPPCFRTSSALRLVQMKVQVVVKGGVLRRWSGG